MLLCWHLYFKPAALDSSFTPVCLCRVMMQPDSYLIPAALYHVSGGTEQAVRTQDDSEVEVDLTELQLQRRQRGTK